MPKFMDLTGRKFNRLTVTKRAPNQGNATMWHCICECGSKRVVSSSHLRNENIKSCGCLHDEMAAERKTTHGLSHLPEHRIWKGMRQRCYTPSNPRYSDYGGRGIEVCEHWRDSFENFYEDMRPRPSPLYSLDRIDNDGDYSPKNCRWATHKQQARNARSNRLLAFRGRTLCVAEWAKIMGVHYTTLIHRLNSGWSIPRALTQPARKY